MSLNFTFINWETSCKSTKEFCIKAIAKHEFGHAIGFAHEQNRFECTFDKCYGKEKGMHGDIHSLKCDPNSIMNGCNKEWQNNGQLSDLDIEAAQNFYGYPNDYISFNSTPDFAISVRNMEAQQTSFFRRKPPSQRVNVFVSETTHRLDSVASVTYDLGPHFKNRSMLIDNRDSSFGIGLEVAGEIEISATIKYLDGTEKTISQKLSPYFETTTEKIK